MPQPEPVGTEVPEAAAEQLWKRWNPGRDDWETIDVETKESFREDVRVATAPLVEQLESYKVALGVKDEVTAIANERAEALKQRLARYETAFGSLCFECGGSGEVPGAFDDDTSGGLKVCGACNGKGTK